MPTTGKYPLVQIESIYLTKDGLVTGKPCQIILEGFDKLATTKDHGVITALDGTPYIQTVDTMLGKPVAIRFVQMAESVYDSIVTEIQNVLDGSKSELDIEVSNYAYGTFSIDVVPDVNPVRHTSEQSFDYVKNGSFHFLTT